MNKLDKVTKKIKELELLKVSLDQKEIVLNSLIPLGEKLSESIKAKTVSNKMAVFKEIMTGVEKAINESDNSADIIKAIETQTKGLKDTNGKKIVNGIKSLLIKLEALEKKTSFDQGAFKTLFENAVKNIFNSISVPNEIPHTVLYSRTSNDKISKITEQFDDYTLEHKWRYDGKGNLKEVETRRIGDS